METIRLDDWDLTLATSDPLPLNRRETEIGKMGRSFFSDQSVAIIEGEAREGIFEVLHLFFKRGS